MDNSSTKLAKDFKNGRPDSNYNRTQLQMGMREETEHTDNLEIAESIAKDHLDKIPDYYTRLMKMENEAKAEMKGKEKPKEMAEEFVKKEKARKEELINDLNKAGQGRGRMPGGFGQGPSGYCVCPKCGERKKHARSVPCYTESCPECGSKMIRDRE